MGQLRQANFWISSVVHSGDQLCLAGHNFKQEKFEIAVEKYFPVGPVDFDQIKWDEGSFLVWVGDDLWYVDISLSMANPNDLPDTNAIPDSEFPYHEHGLSPIIFSQITGAIVANL